MKKSERKTISNTKFVLMMLICIVVWALAFPLIKLALTDLSYSSLTIIRFFIVCIAALCILITQPKKFSRLEKRDIPSIFLLGFFGVMIYHFGLNYGEQYVSPSVASLIIATIPVFSIILAVIFLKEKLTKKKSMGVVIALIGVMIISLWGTFDASLQITYLSGAFAILIAAIMGSIYTIAGKKLLSKYSPLSLTIYAMLLGSLVLIPSAALTPSLFSEIAQMSLTSWFAVLFLGLGSTIIGYVLWYMALEKKNASEISAYLYGIPVLSTIISYILFGDRITLFFILGGIFVIIGLVIVNQNKKRGEARRFL